MSARSLIETGRSIQKSVKDAGLAVRKRAKLWVREYSINMERIYNSNLFPRGEKKYLTHGRYLFWLEKWLLVCDFVQLMGLYWITANPWPIPYPMVTWMQWCTWFNLDYFSNVEGGALNGQSGNISISRWGTLNDYAIGYAFPLVFLLLMVLVTWYAYERIYCDKYGERGDIHRHTARTTAFMIVNVLYIPVGIAVSRIYYCEQVTNPAHSLYGKYVLAADYDMLCWEGAHIAYIVVLSLVYLPIMIVFPFLLYKYTKDNVVYNHPSDHEKRLQAWEIAYMMGIDNYFLDNQTWVLAPHTLPASFFRFWATIYKAVLLILSVSIRGDGTNGAEGGNNAHKELQSALYWIATVVFLSRFIFFNRASGLRGPSMHMAPFRVPSSNVLFYIMSLILFANTTIGTCNAWGVVNAITVNSNQTLLLSITTFGGIGLLLLMFVAIILNPFALWPSNRTLHRIQQNIPFAQLARRWIRVLHRAHKIKMSVLTSPPEVADVKAFESTIRALRSCWLEARYKGSIFDTILQEVIEEMVIHHSIRAASFSRRDDKWDTAYEEAVSFKVFENRATFFRLMSPIKRRILNKLLALRLLQDEKPGDDELVHALQDSGLAQAYNNILALERRTTLYLQKSDENYDGNLLDQVDVVAGPRGDGDGAASKVLTIGDSSALKSRQIDTEELLALWEQIIAALEEGLDSGDVFSQKIFTGEKLERWYGFRDRLMELLTDIKARSDAAGFVDPALEQMHLLEKGEDVHEEEQFSFEDFYAEIASSSKTNTDLAKVPATFKQVSFRQDDESESASLHGADETVNSGSGSISDAASFQGQESDDERLNDHVLVGHDASRRRGT